MRITKEKLKEKTTALENDLDAAKYALRLMVRQAKDRELLANHHNEPLVSRQAGTQTVTEFAASLLDRFDREYRDSKK